MPGIDHVSRTLQHRLEELAEQHGVVGASAAVQQGDMVVSAATGSTNLRTGVPVTTDTVFQIGSISKLYTAVLVLQLVEEGLVDLDAPVRTYLPDFAVADADATKRITVRHLLSHTSGMDGDVFTDFGRGDDCIEQYVGAMTELVQTGPPGAFFSYCNSGYVLLGRLIEHLRGLTWDAALRKHLLEPLGADDTVTLAEEAILRRAAIGHLPTGENGALEVAPVWFFSRALGPAGSIVAPAGDLLRFARMLLEEGRAPDGSQLLAPATIKSMRELQVRLLEPYTLGDGWGLGLIRYRDTEPVVIGHDGTTVGQQAYLRIVPEADLCVALLCNGGAMGALFDDLVRPLLRELAKAELHPNPSPPDQPVDVDPTPFLGTYERSGVRLEVSRDGVDRLWLTATATGPLAATMPQEPPRQLSLLDTETMITTEADPRVGKHLTVRFFDSGTRGFAYLHYGARATPRTAR